MRHCFFRKNSTLGLVGMFLVCLFFSKKIGAQNTEILTPQAFFEVVGKFHPVARQADFLQKRANAALRSARGQFDPILDSNFDEKNFKDKNYYSRFESSVRLPSWYGLEGQAGYSTASGYYLDPEATLPANGQAFAGVSLSVWQGFFMDERRAALGKAKNLAFFNETERLAAINDLIFEAGKTYWEWSFANEMLEVRQRFLGLAQARFEGVRESARLGDRPAIDTLESFLQVEERRADLLESEANFRQAEQKLAVFLWKNDGQPQSIPTGVKPVSIFFKNDFGEIAGDFSSNPAFRQYNFKLRELEIERRLKLEKRKPKLELKYNFLTDGPQIVGPDGLAGFKYGVKFSYPIMARTARAEVQIQDFKIAETKFQQSLKGQEVQQKSLFYQTSLENLEQQAAILENIQRGHRTLLAAEQERFRLGESSVFLLNARENKLLETETKLLKTAAEQQKARLGRQWAAGILRAN